MRGKSGLRIKGDNYGGGECNVREVGEGRGQPGKGKTVEEPVNGSKVRCKDFKKYRQ